MHLPAPAAPHTSLLEEETPGQTWLQPPQLLLSLFTLTQLAPHGVYPLLQPQTPAPEQFLLAPHDCWLDVKKHPWPSWPHVAYVVVVGHTLAVLLQFASALQVHAADGATPVHDWCAPQPVPAFHPVQPLPCATHVCTPAPPHFVAPLVHALVQHEADPALP